MWCNWRTVPLELFYLAAIQKSHHKKKLNEKIPSKLSHQRPIPPPAIQKLTKKLSNLYFIQKTLKFSNFDVWNMKIIIKKKNIKKINENTFFKWTDLLGFMYVFCTAEKNLYFLFTSFYFSLFLYHFLAVY